MISYWCTYQKPKSFKADCWFVRINANVLKYLSSIFSICKIWFIYELLL